MLPGRRCWRCAAAGSSRCPCAPPGRLPRLPYEAGCCGGVPTRLQVIEDAAGRSGPGCWLRGFEALRRGLASSSGVLEQTWIAPTNRAEIERQHEQSRWASGASSAPWRSPRALRGCVALEHVLNPLLCCLHDWLSVFHNTRSHQEWGLGNRMGLGTREGEEMKGTCHSGERGGGGGLEIAGVPAPQAVHVTCQPVTALETATGPAAAAAGPGCRRRPPKLLSRAPPPLPAQTAQSPAQAQASGRGPPPWCRQCAAGGANRSAERFEGPGRHGGSSACFMGLCLASLDPSTCTSPGCGLASYNRPLPAPRCPRRAWRCLQPETGGVNTRSHQYHSTAVHGLEALNVPSARHPPTPTLTHTFLPGTAQCTGSLGPAAPANRPAACGTLPLRPR